MRIRFQKDNMESFSKYSAWVSDLKLPISEPEMLSIDSVSPEIS